MLDCNKVGCLNGGECTIESSTQTAICQCTWHFTGSRCQVICIYKTELIILWLIFKTRNWLDFANFSHKPTPKTLNLRIIVLVTISIILMIVIFSKFWRKWKNQQFYTEVKRKQRINLSSV